MISKYFCNTLPSAWGLPVISTESKLGKLSRISISVISLFLKSALLKFVAYCSPSKLLMPLSLADKTLSPNKSFCVTTCSGSNRSDSLIAFWRFKSVIMLVFEGSTALTAFASSVVTVASSSTITFSTFVCSETLSWLWFSIWSWACSSVTSWVGSSVTSWVGSSVTSWIGSSDSRFWGSVSSLPAAITGIVRLEISIPIIKKLNIFFLILFPPSLNI